MSPDVQFMITGLVQIAVVPLLLSTLLSGYLLAVLWAADELRGLARTLFPTQRPVDRTPVDPAE